MKDPAFYGSMPPSLAHSPFLAALVVMAIMGGVLLVFQWSWGVIFAMIHDPAPLRHPITAIRIIKLLLVVSAFIKAFPRLLQVMVWDVLSPDSRESLALSSWLVNVPWVALVLAAWWVDRLTGVQVRQQLRRFPPPDTHLPEVLESIAGQKTRGVMIVFLIFVVAFTTTYVRPHHASAPIVKHR